MKFIENETKLLKTLKAIAEKPILLCRTRF